MPYAYYNEIEPYAAQWLRNLIADGHIAPGVVDERSIEDVRPIELAEFTQCHFFAGIGVWSHALRAAGWPDDRPVWTGSCPCQPFSSAGKRRGEADERHLWPDWFHLIRVCRPAVVFGEQVASKDGLAWLDVVRTDLAGEGYRSGAADLCAAGVGAPHVRQRIFFGAHAYANGNRLEAVPHEGVLRLSDGDGRRPGRLGEVGGENFWSGVRPTGARPVAVGDGPADGLGQLRAYGNAIVPQVATEFIKAFRDCLP